MTNQQIIETKGARQVTITRKDNLLHPTPVEIRMAIANALIEDANDPSTPHIPAHVMGLVRRAIEAANRGLYQ